VQRGSKKPDERKIKQLHRKGGREQGETSFYPSKKKTGGERILTFSRGRKKQGMAGMLPAEKKKARTEA